jgi:lysophospholipase L1-like esterase
LSLLGPIRKLLGHDSRHRPYHSYIALGDSISIDDYPGEDKGAASLLYRNQDHLYPDFAGKDLLSKNPEMRFVCLAQDGATSYDVLHEQLPLLKGSGARTLFTLTAAGNDLLSLQSDPDEVIFRIRTIVEQTQRLYPNSEMVIGTTYDPSDGVGDLQESVILETELKSLHAINRAVMEMARPPQIRVADIYTHFLGHGKHCKEKTNPYYRPDNPALWYVLVIEPNAAGAHEIRKLFWNAIQPE